MSVKAVAELVVDAERGVAWNRFANFTRWHMWMPTNFRPIAGPTRVLQAGDRLTVGIGEKARLKIKLDVVRLRPGEEICWRGGNLALLRGDHSFVFRDEAGGRTRIRSEELMRGLLTIGPLGARIERESAQAAKDLMTRFAQYMNSPG